MRNAECGMKSRNVTIFWIFLALLMFGLWSAVLLFSKPWRQALLISFFTTTSIFGVIVLYSYFNTWSRLAKQYRARGQVSTNQARQEVALCMIGGPYSVWVIIEMGAEGIYLALTDPHWLAPGNPPLLIPWNQITEIRKTRWPLLYPKWFGPEEYAELDVGDSQITTIYIPWIFIEKCRQWLDPKLVIASDFST